MFESIERIDVLPSLVKNEEGYSYPEEYINNIFLYKDDLIFFHESTYDTIPTKFIEILFKKLTAEKIDTRKIDKIEIQLKKTNESIDHINKQLEMIRKRISDLEEITIDVDQESKELDIKDLVQKIVASELQEKVNHITEVVDAKLETNIKQTSEVVNNKISEVYENYMPTLQKVINETIDERLKELQPKSKTINFSELYALKEAFSAEEIVKLREAGIV